MHKLVFVLSEPQWTLSTEASTLQFHYPTLRTCSLFQSRVRHISPGVVTSVAEVLVLKCLIKMRWMLSRWNTTVLILLDCNYCSSAPLPCPAQPGSRTSLDTSASQSAWTVSPACAGTAMHRASYLLGDLNVLPFPLPMRCPSNPEEVGHPVWDPVA